VDHLRESDRPRMDEVPSTHGEYPDEAVSGPRC